ncbi:MAG: hypothetical protein DCC65_16650 [Planctomycetota bacterium]|nr:MAG: hypothetical protein DCC65_16650 [Planctomycetota bacterium]
MLAATLLTAGCFGETSHPIRPGDYHRLSANSDSLPARLSARSWLRQAHRALAPLLPPEGAPPLLTEDMIDSNGRPIDVLKHFGLRRGDLEKLSGNCSGLSHTAQLAGSDFVGGAAPHWPGFDPVWVPVNDRISLFGLMGHAVNERGETREADCIVILPGILGHTDISRTRDLAAAFVQNGYHALAIELRGHGQTDMRYPDVYYTFGTLETDDLMAVSEWLTAQPQVRRTGLIGFCWGANHALLCAWEDGRPEHHASISPRLVPYLRPRNGRRHYEAGIMAFSPTLRFEEIIDGLDVDRAGVEYPVQANLQVTIETRVAHKRHDRFSGFDARACPGSLRKLIDYEFTRSELKYPECVADGLRFMRFLPYNGLEDGWKLRDARVPVLIVQGANDPLACAQDVADLIARCNNPNVAALILPGGGHVGFAAYARPCYFSLILNFFDPGLGPRAVSSFAAD